MVSPGSSAVTIMGDCTVGGDYRTRMYKVHVNVYSTLYKDIIFYIRIVYLYIIIIMVLLLEYVLE